MQIEEQRRQLAAEVAEEHAEQRRQKKESRRLERKEYMTSIQVGGGWSMPISKDKEVSKQKKFNVDAAFNYGV